MSEDDDRLFAENVDDGAKWIGRIKHSLGLLVKGDESKRQDTDEEDSQDSNVDSLDSFIKNLADDEVVDMKKVKSQVYKDSEDPY